MLILGLVRATLQALPGVVVLKALLSIAAVLRYVSREEIDSVRCATNRGMFRMMSPYVSCGG